MFEEHDVEGTEVEEASAAQTEQEPAVEEPRIMCYVSKEMVPMSHTIEVEYEAGKTFRVMPKYVKYATATTE